MEMYTVAIIGCGSRGHDAFGLNLLQKKNKFKIVALCDVLKEKADRCASEFEVPSENVFYDEETFFQEKRADAIIIATHDRDHVRMAIKSLSLGYAILMEKPISPIKEELLRLLDAHKQYPQPVMICHVLRYAPAYVKIKKLLEQGRIGRLLSIDWLEQVCYWHQSHSYVRGNWRREEDSSPMIMAKCCHDLDLLQWYAEAKSVSVYSIGERMFFNKENAPYDAANRCFECKYNKDCPYSAEYQYIDRWKKAGSPKSCWPWNVIDDSLVNTEESLRKAYKNGSYGRCVFACDNDVVDHQVVVTCFENGVVANLTMTAFANDGGRRATFRGSLGEIEFNQTEDSIRISQYGKETCIYKLGEWLKSELEDTFGHGGGDTKLIDGFYDLLSQGVQTGTTLENSVESHLMALAAEESRKQGRVCLLSEFRKE